MQLAIRAATPADAGAITHVRIATWRVAYRGLIPDDVLDGLDPVAETRGRLERWRERHSDPRLTEVVALRGGEVIGWACGGPGRAEPEVPPVVVPWAGAAGAAGSVGSVGDPGPPVTVDDGDRGELYALYVLPERWGSGAGHALIEQVTADLRAAGCTVASLWVLDGNDRAAAFYERHGWVEDGATKQDRVFLSGYVLPERRRVRTL